MITKISGKLQQLGEDIAILEVPPFHYEVLIPDFTRRQLQLKLDHEIELHTIDYIDGNVQRGGRMTPRLIGFNSLVEREFFEICLLYTSPSPRDQRGSRMPSSA